MAVENHRVPYEILIRYDEGGRPKAAHVQYRNIVTADGVVIKNEVEVDVAPVSLEDFASNELMTKSAEDALLEVTRLNLRVEMLEAQLAEREAPAADAP